MCNIQGHGILTGACGELSYPFGRNMGGEELIFLRVLPVTCGFPSFSFIISILLNCVYILEEEGIFLVSPASVCAPEKRGKVHQSSLILSHPSEVTERRF
jgi:hypothetical protein